VTQLSHDSADQAEALGRMESAENYNRWLADRARPYVYGHVLDLGAGTGTFTLPLAAGATDIVALEPDPLLASVLRSRAASLPSIEDVEKEASGFLASSDARFDAIVCINVLEHIEADGDIVSACFEALTPGAHLLLLVPAHEALFGAIDEMTGHFRRYGASGLRTLLKQTGFEVLDLRHVNPVGALGWIVISRLLRRDQVPLTPLGTYDRIVPVLRQLDRLRLPFGLSLWAVARRPPDAKPS
jgi:SAM-dependent methyltransferase